MLSLAPKVALAVMLMGFRKAKAVELKRRATGSPSRRSEEHTSELQSQSNLVCRLLLEKKNNDIQEKVDVRCSAYRHDAQRARSRRHLLGSTGLGDALLKGSARSRTPPVSASVPNPCSA